MNTDTLKADLRNLFPKKVVSDHRLTSIIKGSFLEMAHHLDLPDAEDFPDDVTVVSGTPNYDVTLSSGKNVDRITSAVFVSGTTKQVLTDWNMRLYQHAYRGSATTGTPYAFCFYKRQLWLYYIPDLGGTVYLTCQHVLTDLTSFPDNYYPLMETLVTCRVYDKGSREWMAAYRAKKDLIKSFKGRMHPKKVEMEKSLYRSLRIQDLNTEI